MPISKETANRLLAGEFKTLEEFFEFASGDIDTTLNIEILYRRVENTNREADVYIIETIFIDE